jgi:hypothetical protein
MLAKSMKDAIFLPYRTVIKTREKETKAEKLRNQKRVNIEAWPYLRPILLH